MRAEQGHSNLTEPGDGVDVVDGRWAFRGEPWLLVALALVLTLLASFFPASGDDWAWGSQDGAERYHRWFDHYNGRWAGNLLVLVLTRATWLAPVVVALTACLVVHLVTRVAGLRTPAGYAAAIAIFVAMPLPMWRQTMVWVSGFSNYVPATACLLLFIVCVQRDWSGRPWRHPRARAAAVFVLAFVSALFMEHVTVVLCLAAMAHLALLRWRRRDRAWGVAAAWAGGILAGAVLMFSNSIYRSAAEGEASYQQVNGGGLGQILRDGVTGVSQLSVGMNMVLNLSILLVLLGLVLVARTRGPLTWRQRTPVACALVGWIAGIVVTSRVKPLDYFGDLNGLAWLSSVGMLLAIVLGARALVEDRAARRSILLLTSMAFLLIAPATVVQPYTPRVFLPAYVLMLVIVLIMGREIAAARPHPWLAHGVVAAGGVVTLAVLATYFVVYVDLDRAVDERIATIREQVADGATEVTVPNLPHIGYVHYPDPRSTTYRTRFKEYYGLPADLVIDNPPRP